MHPAIYGHILTQAAARPKTTHGFFRSYAQRNAFSSPLVQRFTNQDGHVVRTFSGNGWLAEAAHVHTECLGGLGSATDIARLEDFVCELLD